MLTGSSGTITIQRPTFTYREVSDMSVALTNQVRLMQSMKSVYQAPQQAKLLHLHSDVESLLLQLQNLKQQRQAEDN